ncbi:MAG: lysoplasmalogenase [Actinobacteria bacterium]|nr:lysoplasmalogenase [Actinomycetota bacterium]NIS37168.1 lysoplasmalogenase [Actinomycetota bacterium]NIT99116.1 lysoplasmalogenase [Actinomycetota bacterium]NIU22731.1 lysoplasmalogenase [Actinomycetota bacterium]NIU71614.1 lysoplasmalogenase [Actinomycetota bacterium]
MNTATVVLLLVAAVAMSIDWWSVATDRLGVEFLAKPAVIIALIGVALAIDTADNVERGVIIAALGASLVGDVVLMTPDARFEAGLGAFLLAHVLYVVAFAPSLEVGPAVAAATLVVGLSLGVVPQMMERVRAGGRLLSFAVPVYIVAIGATAVTAAGTGVIVTGLGGAAFFFSDALLGWNRFVGPAPGGRVLVHVTYHLGQVGLVLWLAA